MAQQQCATCHAIGRGSAASPNAKAPAFRTIATVPGMTALALGVALRTPHREMPNIILEDRQRDDVVAYISEFCARTEAQSADTPLALIGPDHLAISPATSFAK